ncbi:MAG TPA: dTDP-4-dehydrorhamnose reductase [Nitrospirae bacterium]|nr:dTDP-4-dehydrorhamnose reductase [Nitrospirota bacterium]
MKKIFITGRYGQLANEFERYLTKNSIDYIALEINELDITNFKSVVETIKDCSPSVIINCAAYNLVDQAEQDYLIAHKVNVLGPRNLAISSLECGAAFVHYSSDYVFDGAKIDDLYIETDSVNPINEYGKSKLLGEKAVFDITSSALIFRLSWVFGEGKQNFIYKLIKWQENSSFLKIACDEFSIPTYTEMVVEVTMKSLEKSITGLYHLTNTDYCSRYEWARFILKKLGINKHVHPVSMSIFNLPAKRPAFSAMNNEEICSLLNIQIPTWQESVEFHIKKYLHSF